MCKKWLGELQAKVDFVRAFYFSLWLHNRNVSKDFRLTIQPQIWENLATTARLGFKQRSIHQRQVIQAKGHSNISLIINWTKGIRQFHPTGVICLVGKPFKGQLISKCPFGVFISTKKPQMIFF